MTSSTEPVLIVGLGNPGSQYSKTRHNIGFMVADVLATEAGSGFSAHKRSGAEIVQIRISGKPTILAKPRSYMNLSGTQVAAAAKFFSIPAGNIVVIHDELDLDFGQLRLKRGGGEGGHNGLRSISTSLGTKDYLRVRVGIGRPPGRMDPASYVLKPFSTTESKELGVLCQEAAEATALLLELGLEAAQNTIHAR
ncbi:MAG: aminoacyl-tRNA hydrolase [Mycobacteriaceae bacterium]